MKYVNRCLIGLMFVANLVMGDKLDTWSLCYSNTSQYFTGVTYGSGIFVVVGQSGLILTSPDGFNWTQRSSGTATWLSDVAFANNTFVSVGQTGVVLTSTDGFTWTPHTSGTSADFNRIRFINGQFIAVGDEDAIATSPDGITWTIQNSGLPTPVTPPDPNDYLGFLYNVGYGNGIYIIVGKSSTILTSPDAIHWAAQNIPDGFTGDVAYGNGQFVISAYGGVILTSSDASNWTQQPRLPLPNTGLSGIVFGQGEFVGCSGGDQIFTSPDGTNWTERYSGGSSLNLWNVKYVNGAFMAVGDAGTILQSESFFSNVLELSNVGQFNYFGNGYDGASEVRYTNPVAGLFESTNGGILFKANGYRGEGQVITKASYYLPGSTAEFVWSGSGGASFMQSVCGSLTKPWQTDPSNLGVGPLITEYGNLYASTWLATPERIYRTTVTFTTNSYSLATMDYLTAQEMGTSSGAFDFTSPMFLYLRTGDTYDYQNAYLLLQGLTLFPPSLGITIVEQPQSQFVQAGASATFSITAGGQQPLSYQWQFNGGAIVGATSSSITLNSVSVASSGAYSVIVSNPYGSATSQIAYLSVLGNGAIGTTPTQTTATPLPSKPAGVTKLVLITHGWEPEGPASDLSWMNQMQADIISQVNSSDCFVTTYPWVGSTWLAGAWTLDPDTALYHAKIIGTELGYQIGNGFQFVHLISHSAGAGLIEAAAAAIRQVSPTTIIQETFLDPYTGPLLEGRSEYGMSANWADDYFVVDLTDAYGDLTTGCFDSTSGQLRYAYNVDVSGTLQAPLSMPVFYSGIAGSTPPVINTSADPSHGTPIDFYTSTINGTAPACAVGYGFPLSVEAGGSGNWSSYPVNNTPLPLCSALTISQNQQPIFTSSSLNFLQLPTGTSSGAVNLFGAGANLSADDPCWLAVGVTITNAVNFIQFDCGFTDTNQTDGLLTVYWNTNQVGEVDERVAPPPASQTYRFALPTTASSGLYTLSFRLNAFSEATSVAITNVTTGFIGVTQPINLQIQAPVTGSALALQLTAPSGYEYLVQSSTNLLDWTPLAVLVNTNGTVPFTDSTWTNANARFYRALIP